MVKHAKKYKESLAMTHPQLVTEWHPTKNALAPVEVTAGSDRKVWWRCTNGIDHEWQATISSRVAGNGCGCCHGLVVVPSICLATTRPDLALLWHSTKNKLTPREVTSGSEQKVWWKCPAADDHEWQASPKSMSRESNTNTKGCPYCRGLKVSFSNCLAANRFDLALQWHPTKNGVLSPQGVTVGSNRVVWWKCPQEDDHEWQATVSNRTGQNQTECPFCSTPARLVAKSNCLATTHPEVAKEWHPTKNRRKTPQLVSHGHTVKVWWVCNREHEWMMSPCARTSQNQGCPICCESKGERTVRLVLQELGVVFSEQYTIAGCRYKRLLPFDFVVFKEGRHLIEFQGQQHYNKGVKGSTWKLDFEYQVLRDRIKVEFCQKSRIPLLVIPYWEMANVKPLITEFLAKS